jgi:transposase-like protein
MASNEHDYLSLGSLDDPRFTDSFAAADYLEWIRWPSGPICPHCGEANRKPYRLKNTTRKLWKCAACRKQYTVTIGTIFESSHVPLHKWLLAFYLLCSSKKGMSAHQLHRMLGVTYKTAWFMFHRVREAMRDPAFTSRLSGTVEADETYIGGKRRAASTSPAKPSVMAKASTCGEPSTPTRSRILLDPGARRQRHVPPDQPRAPASVSQ